MLGLLDKRFDEFGGDMAKQKNTEGNFVKMEIMLIVALIALVIGFLGGIFYSAFQDRYLREVYRLHLVLPAPPNSNNSRNLTCQMSRQKVFYPWSRRWLSIRPTVKCMDTVRPRLL